MPEGDTLRRAEALLSPVLDGRVVTDIWFRMLRGHRPRAGQRIERVNAVGKHLLIEFDKNLTLRTHLGMSGNWRVIAPGARVPNSPKLRVRISTEIGTALCFAAPTIETFVRGDGPSPIDRLGPDLSDDEVDIDVVVQRTRDLAGSKLLAEALLDQTVAAGVGNVYKSEVAFIVSIHPFAPVSALTDSQLHRVWSVAHKQLLDNRSRRFRKTTPDGVRNDHFVYDRFRMGCLRCSDAIRYAAAGDRTERSTYWCPRCQVMPDTTE